MTQTHYKLEQGRQWKVRTLITAFIIFCVFLSGIWQGCVDRLSLNEGKLIKTQSNGCKMNC